MYVYLIETKTVHSSGIVQCFDMVNHLDTVETGHMQTPSTCLHSPASLFQGLEKAGGGGGGLEMRLHTHLIQCGWLGTRLPFDRSNAPTQA